jgi:GNAT superfamily N-acetyltransferase
MKKYWMEDMHFKNNITSKQFIDLRKEGPFMQYEEVDVITALKNTLYSVVIYEDELAIGMGRVVGDGRISFFIKDIVVKKDHQGKGVGSLIMELLLDYIKANGARNAYIGLMSTVGLEGFYEKFGFIRRPNESFGAGMIMYLKDDT